MVQEQLPVIVPLVSFEKLTLSQTNWPSALTTEMWDHTIRISWPQHLVCGNEEGHQDLRSAESHFYHYRQTSQHGFVDVSHHNKTGIVVDVGRTITTQYQDTGAVLTQHPL